MFNRSATWSLVTRLCLFPELISLKLCTGLLPSGVAVACAVALTNVIQRRGRLPLFSDYVAFLERYFQSLQMPSNVIHAATKSLNIIQRLGRLPSRLTSFSDYVA